MKLFFKLIGVSFRSQMQHRASFVMLSLALFLSSFVDIIGIWVLFDRFKLLQGWTFEELAVIYGIMHMGFATAESLGRGFDTFGLLVKSGDFDRLLLRPVGTLIQVATREVMITRIGRFLQGLVVLLWGCFVLKISLLSWKAGIILMSYLGTAALFYGLLILQGTLSFWTTETLEIMNILTFGGMETGQFPMTIYKPSFRLFFTFIVPLACVGYYPIATMLKHESMPIWIGVLLPFAGVIFLWISTYVWELGVRRYHSTGS